MDEYLEEIAIRQMREQDIVQAADLMIEYDWSIRYIAANMGLSPSRIYRYLRYELKHISSGMYRQCRRIMKKHRWNRAGILW